MIYLDNCATTRVRTEVADAMYEVLTKDFANPSSLHKIGLEIENRIDNAREIIAKYLNVSPDEIYFTSGGTESNNLIIRSILDKNQKRKGKIITSKLEHSSVKSILNKAREDGFEIIEIDSDKYGSILVNELEKYLDEDTLLVTIVHVNNELGAINDLKKIGETIKDRAKNAHFHIDAIQSFGKLKFNLNEFNCHSLSASAHKVHGPKGVGLIYIKRDVHIRPLIYGGGQEDNLRSGTENTPGIVGFGKAVEILSRNFDKEYAHKAKLREY
ncbi:MAG: cysteine desulfurase family protein, partial [Tissierellia bacterium]|nr:cysteine desulfurase family protein [Tissierellia bacterium]